MSDAAAQPWNDSASPATTAAATPGATVQDALAGDWSEGLAGAARQHGLPMPAPVEPSALLNAPEPPVQRKAAEELAAEASGALPVESQRTEQASAKAIFALAQQKAAEEARAAQAASAPAAPTTPKHDTDESAPLDASVAADISRALALESAPPAVAPEQPSAADDPWKTAAVKVDAPTPWSDPSPEGALAAAKADEWAQATASAGPDLWGGAASAKEAAPPAAEADESVSASWDAPDKRASTDPTMVHPGPISPQPGEEDLPVPVPAEAPPGQPSFLAGEPRVVVHTLAGRVKRGTLRAPDLAKPELRLSPQVGGAEERIALSDVKAVFFMLTPGEQPPEFPGGRVRVTLSDGRLLDGFRESDGPGGGLFLVPLDAARTNTRSIFVCGDAIQAIDQA